MFFSGLTIEEFNIVQLTIDDNARNYINIYFWEYTEKL